MHDIWLDTDPGFDDWMAMLLLAGDPRLRWVGTSVVAGNAPLAVVWRNAQRIAHAQGWRVPLHAGCAQPLAGSAQTAQYVLGEEGMRSTGEALASTPHESAPASDAPAVNALIAAVRAAPGELTLVAIGPLTNIAAAVRRAPDVARQVRELVLMGGSTDRGNHTAAAEFNVAADPEAAAVVFDAGFPLRMFGLNACRQVRIDADHVARLRAVGTARARCFAGYLEAYLRIASPDGSRSMALYDPCAIAWLRWPELFHFEPARVDIELQGTHTRGMTVCEFRAHRARPQVQVAMQVDGPALVDRIVAALEQVLR